MSARRLTACRILGSAALAVVLASLAVAGASVITAAHHGTLFPAMHWGGR